LLSLVCFPSRPARPRRVIPARWKSARASRQRGAAGAGATIHVLHSYQELLGNRQGNRGEDPIPPREQFIDALKVSPELRAWLKGHDTLDLAEPDLDKLLTPEDILNVPEFLLAYQRSNRGGVTQGLPKPSIPRPTKQSIRRNTRN